MPSMLVRLRFTPLQDLLRGRVTGRLDWRQTIASFDVAPEAKGVVTAVVHATRLWAIEKADVAVELLAHFADGLEAGSTSDELIDEFGDIRRAALLIRRSKIRSQPLAWQICRWASVSIGLLLIFYCGVAVFFYSGHPSPKVDFIAGINRQIALIPADQRAWPIYRSSLILLQGDDGKGPSPLLSDASQQMQWPQIVRWIDDHASAINSIRKATNLPALGFVLGHNGSIADPALFGRLPLRTDENSAENMVTLSMPQLKQIRLLADVLCLDARLAREKGDGKRVEQDIIALLGLAEQERHDGQIYLGQLLSMNILVRSYDELDRTLVYEPKILDEASLVRISHCLVGPTNASDIISFGGERLKFEDVVQRTFTDDGHGSGRLSSAGLDFVRRNFSRSPDLPCGLLMQNTLSAAVQPASLLLMASRKELIDEHERLMEMNDAMIRVPLRKANLVAPYKEWQTLSNTLISRTRYALLLTLTPSLQRAAQRAEQTLGERDGLVVGIALEMYRRRYQHYPDSLAQLTPGLLPSVPADRITGEPLKYRLIEGKPLVYSVGIDRIDDGGLAPVCDGKPDPNAAAGWGPSVAMVSGDWVLYPKPGIPAEEERDN